LRWKCLLRFIWVRGKDLVNRSKVVPVLCHEDIWGSGGMAPPFFTSALAGGVVVFKLLPLYLRRKSPRCPLDRRLGGPQCRSGRCGGEKNLALPGSNTGRPVWNPSLYWLSYSFWKPRDQNSSSLALLDKTIYSTCLYFGMNTPKLAGRKFHDLPGCVSVPRAAVQEFPLVWLE
jgi:hypothetical protein